MTGRTKVAVVTGASSGMGKEAARTLLQQGWKVIGVGRNRERCAAAQAELSSLRGGDFTMIRADISLLSETARAAAEIAALTPVIDALINNAGGVYAERAITAEGIEATFASNHLAPFLLTQKLLPQLRTAAESGGPGSARVIAVTSTGHEHCPGIEWDDLNFEENFVGGAAYCHAKLANLLFIRALAKHVEGTGIVAHAMHPGVVASNFVSHCDPAMRAYMESIADRATKPEDAAATLVWLASADEPGRSSGGYFFEQQPAQPSTAAQDDAAADRLWRVSEALVAAY